MSEAEEDFDAERLLLDINSGRRLRAEDEELVGRLLAAPEDRLLGRHLSQDDIYSLVLLVGRAKLTKYRHLIAAFLDRDDPLTVSLVLEVLCLDWNETPDYLERVISFALGVSWDLEGDVRQTAIRILGEYLSRVVAPALDTPQKIGPGDQHVLSLLVHLFEEDEDEWIKYSAYRALLRSAGVPIDELPAEGVLPDLAPDSASINQPIMSKLRLAAGYSSGSLSGSPSSVKGPASMR